MLAIIIAIFIIGYLAIVFEHPLRLDKTVPALLMGALLWAALAVGFHQGIFSVVDTHENIFSMKDTHSHAMSDGFKNALLHHLGKTAEILIFLIGAMTIVEIVDLHRGFDVLKSYVRTKKKSKLLWIIGALAFILSAIIDNLTATIVLVTLLRKIIKDRNTRLWFAGMIVIAANAGGAWSPIGDVTTTMLWIGGKVSAVGLVKYLIVPSLVCFIIPTLIFMFLPAFKGSLEDTSDKEDTSEVNRLLSSQTMLFLGLGMIVFVPVFKTLTHLPPYVGMMLSLGVVWLVSEYIHPEENFDSSKRHIYSAHKALSRIEMSSILFFLGILMAVAALESLVFGVVNGVEVGTLRYAAEQLRLVIPNEDVVVMLIGACSAIIDNVPLVAASMGMYESPMDSRLWHFIAYAAGTGGSMLIIGSAAGVAAMGMMKIDFIWYLRKIAWIAFVGFVAGGITFVAWTSLLGKESTPVADIELEGNWTNGNSDKSQLLEIHIDANNKFELISYDKNVLEGNINLETNQISISQNGETQLLPIESFEGGVMKVKMKVGEEEKVISFTKDDDEHH